MFQILKESECHIRVFMFSPNLQETIKTFSGPGQIAQLVRALAQCAKAAGSIPGQGTDRSQSMNT